MVWGVRFRPQHGLPRSQVIMEQTEICIQLGMNVDFLEFLPILCFMHKILATFLYPVIEFINIIPLSLANVHMFLFYEFMFL